MSVRVLAIDPGIKRVGWAVVYADPDCITHVASGVIDTPDLSLGLLLGLVRDHDPERAAVERPVGRVFGGLVSLVDTAVLAGVAAGWLEGSMPVELVPATDWRSWLVGIPSAKNAAIAASLASVVTRLPRKSNPDQRDAIALAAFAGRKHTPRRFAA